MIDDASRREAWDERQLGRVILISQYYPPEPVPNPGWIATGLREVGWLPSVLTGLPNYPTGELHAGYRLRLIRDHVDGIPLTRVPLYPDHGDSAVGRTLNYLSWSVAASLCGMAAIRRAQLSLVYLTPATAALPAMLGRALLSRSYVLLIQDIWPDSVFASGFLTAGLLRRVAESTLRRFVDHAYTRAAHIVVTSPGMRDLLMARGVPGDKITLIYNWADEKIYRPAAADPGFRSRIGLSVEDFVVMYAGNHGAAQGLEPFIDAVGALSPDQRCHAVLIGEGVCKADLQRRAAAVAPGRVHFLPQIAPEEMTGVLPTADIHLVSLRDDPLFHRTMPSKVQSIMAAGQPLLVCAPGDAARVTRDSAAGLSARPGDSIAIATAIARAIELGRDKLSGLGRRGRQVYLREMSATIGRQRLSDVLEAVLAASSPSPTEAAGSRQLAG